MKCPICEIRVIDHWLRGFAVGLFLALLIGFIAGQMFHDWQYMKIFKDRVKRLEVLNDELRNGNLLFKKSEEESKRRR